MGAIRYKSQFQSLAGRKYVVNIWDDEWEGSTGEFCLGPEAFELSYEGNTSDIFKPFIPSRLEFTFNVTSSGSENFIYDLAQEETNRFRIFITDGPASGNGTENLFWQGFIQGEGISISDQFYPFEAALTASDISFFNDVEYATANAPISGDATVVEVLNTVLELTGHKSFYTGLIHGFDNLLETSVEWRGFGMASGGDPMTLTQINQWTFFEYLPDDKYNFKNCQEVVEELGNLFGARFFQSGGRFNFAQLDNLVNSTQKYYLYTVGGVETESGTRDTSIQLDRVDLYQMAGGNTQFYPGAKYAEREYVFRRNFLEGLRADNNTVTRNLGDIKLLNYTIFTEPPKFTLKFNIKYRIKEYYGAMRLPFNGAAIARDVTAGASPGNTYNFVPLWRMTLKATGDTDGYTYCWSQAAADVIAGIENCGLSQYKKLIGSRKEWVSILYQFPGWRRDDVLPEEYLYYEIIDEEDYAIPIKEYFDDEYQPFERVVNVEMTIPSVFGWILQQNLNDVYFELSLRDVYNRYHIMYTGLNPAVYSLDDIDWQVDNFELIVHGNTIEEKPETGRKYRVNSPDEFRKKVQLPKCELAAVNSRTFHNIKIYTGSTWLDSTTWSRPGDTSRLLNYLSIEQAVAMNRRGIKLYSGSLVSTSEEIPDYYNVVVKNGVKYMQVQGTFNARFDEWRNANMVELVRDADNLTYETLLSQSSTGGGGGSLPSGNYSPSTPSSDISGGGLQTPEYDFASGQNGSTYTTTINLSTASGYTDAEINASLMVFQDATKLIHGVGYTITDFASGIMTFTNELEDAYLELYYYG